MIGSKSHRYLADSGNIYLTQFLGIFDELQK